MKKESTTDNSLFMTQLIPHTVCAEMRRWKLI